MNYDDIVKTHYIDEYDELLRIIKGKTKYGDLRENYVFRGMKKIYYELIPSSLRKDEYGNFRINKFISDEEFYFRLNLKSETVKEIDHLWNEFENLPDNALVSFITNKNEEPDNGVYPDFIKSFNELQFKREVYVLLKFLKYADQLGLKINASHDIRRWMHNAAKYKIDSYDVWPKPEFYEIISIAQHNQLPTRALDWSYDYKVALHFAVKGIINKDESDCVLWAFNYRLFEKHYLSEKFDSILFKNHNHSKEFLQINKEFKNYIPPFEIYRPEYNSNNNLKSQKGLFTFLNSIGFNDLLSNKPFDKILVELLKENYDEIYGYELNGFERFHINENEKVFHKFIIKGSLKKEILKDLYNENYSEETLFPQFDKIVESMAERVRFEEQEITKSNILLPISEEIWWLIKNKKKNHIIINNYNNEIFDKVYLLSNDKIQGYFYVNTIIKYTTEKLWEKYNSFLNISYHNFLNRIKNHDTHYEISINGLTKFKYPIPLNEYKTDEEYCFIDENSELNFLLNFE